MFKGYVVSKIRVKMYVKILIYEIVQCVERYDYSQKYIYFVAFSIATLIECIKLVVSVRIDIKLGEPDIFLKNILL